MIYPEKLEQIIDFYKKLPGIGEKSAERLALATLDIKEEEILITSNTNLVKALTIVQKNKKVLKINVDSLVKDYLDDKSSTEQGYLRYLTKWLDATKDNPDYEMPKNKCFGSLIRALDFIDFMTNNMSTGFVWL